MSTDPDKATACPIESDKSANTELLKCGENIEIKDECKEKKKIPRSVRFPEEDLIVTQYFEPANPWHDVPSTTKSQIAAEYLEACRRHNTPCIDSVLQQIRELPDNTIGGAVRAPRLTLAECSLSGPAPADALEAVMRKVQFRRVEIEHATIDDEGAEALFDMIEYYESATVLSIAGPRQFGIRGWQAASRMIKKSADLSELEVSDAPLEASHAPVLARSLRAHTCTLRALCLQRVSLCGEPLLCLVIALKSNSSIRELRLCDNRLSVSDASQIASLLRYNSRIQLLDLSNNMIQDAGTAHLADALADQASQSPPSAAASPLSPHRCQVGGHEARGLAFLVLWNNQLTRNCAPYLSKALRSSQSLCVLNIGRNALGNDAVRALARGSALVSLGLQASRLGPDAAALADLIRADTKLQRLDLRENRLGSAGLQAILAAMKDNNTLTQIDLDEPGTPDSSNLTAEDTETALIRRLTREIRALCRRNEPPVRHDEDPTHPVHRKISLTCHTACLLRQGMSVGEEERRTRLRSPAPSPAPSPAGSPVPAPHPTSRFMVTRVTPERDSSTDSSGSTSSSSSTPTRLAYCPPSRFKVVQVMEPPQIQVHPASTQARKSPSRFSVTRNYDSVYNPNPTPPNSPAQPAVYTQLQNEVVTQLKHEAGLSKTDALTQTKNEVVTQLRNEGSFETSLSKSESKNEVARSEGSLSKVEELSHKGLGRTDVLSQVGVGKTDASSQEGLGKIDASSQDSLSKVDKLSQENLSKVDELSKVVTPMISEVSLSKNDGLSQSKIEIVKHEDGLSKTKDEIGTQLVNQASLNKSDALSSEVATQLKHEPGLSNVDLTQSKIESVSQPNEDNIKCELISHEVNAQLDKSDVKSEPIVLESQVKLGKESTGKKVITAQVRNEAMRQSKIESIAQIQLEHESKAQFEFKPAEMKIEPKIEAANLPTDSTKNTVTTQFLHKSEPKIHVKHESETQLPNVPVTVKNEPIEAKTESTTTNKNAVTTQLHKEPVLDKVESKILPKTTSSQIISNVPSTSQTDVTKQAKYSSIESVILDKITLGTELEMETPTQIRNVPYIVPFVQARNNTVIQCSTAPVAQVSKHIDSTSQINVPEKSPIVESVIQTKNGATADMTVELKKLPVEPPIQNVEPLIQERNKTVTQFSTEPKTLAKVEPTSQTKIDDKLKIVTVEPPIQLKTIENQLVTELTAQLKNLSIGSTSLADIGIKQVESKKNEPFVQGNIIVATFNEPELTAQPQNVPKIAVKAETEPVSLFQIIKSDTQVKPELPLAIESSNSDLDSAAQLRGLIETSSKIKTSPSHSILPKTSIATIEEFPESDDIEFSDSTTSSITLLSTDNATSDSSKTKSNNESETQKVEHASTDSKSSAKTLESKIEFTDSKIVTGILTELCDTPKSAELSAHLVPQTDNMNSEVTNLKNVKTLSENNVIDISIKPTIVTSELTYSEVLKSDKKSCDAMNNIVEDLGNIIKEIKVLVKNKNSLNDVPADSVILKKNKSESSLDSPDLEVSRLMENRREERSVFDSNSSLEISGSSVESLNEQINRTVQELDRRKTTVLSNEGSMESTSEVTPVNSGNFLNLSLSSNESVSPIFGKTKLIHDSLSSLEASVSSLDSAKHDRVMVTSADSGIEYSLQQPSENREDNSSNEGTLTNNSSLKETVKKPETFQLVDTLTTSPKRASSLLDVPALKNKGLDRMRKISWVAPSSSFHIPKPEEKDAKPSNLEKLLSLFQHPSSIFSRSLTSDDEKKSASNTPPRKDSSLTSSFWTWGSTIEREREEDSSEATDSTLSERVQVSFVDESFSRKLDSKTPSTDTDNTLSEFQSFPTQESELTEERVTKTTEDKIVQNLDLSVISNTKRDDRRSDDLVREEQEKEKEKELARPRSFAAVLKSSGSENSLDKQNSPDNGQSVDKLPSKVIRGIKENISPENTLTSSMTNTKALAVELERQVKNPTTNPWDVKNDPKIEEVKVQSDLAPIATIEETLDEDNPLQLAFIDDIKLEDMARVNVEGDKDSKTQEIDLGKDALSYLIYENRDFEIGAESMVKTTAQQGSLAEELKEAEIKEILDLSPELVIDDSLQDNVFTAKEIIGLRTSPIIPERAKLKKSNSLEDLSQLSDEKSPKTKTIAFKVPESTTPRDIPERRSKLRTRSGSSPKSLPESLNKPCPLAKMESVLTKKKKKVSSLGKMARDSLLALNMSEEEIAEFRRSYKLTSVESLRSLESVSESGNSVDSRCRACLRQSQESLMSLDSISEDCRCTDECDRAGKSAR